MLSQQLAKIDSWLYNKRILSLFILNFFNAVMFNRIIYKFSISPLLVTAVCLCNFCLQMQPAWSQQVRPRAIVMGLNFNSAPEVSEQILLQKLREKLEHTFDLTQCDFKKLNEKNIPIKYLKTKVFEKFAPPMPGFKCQFYLPIQSQEVCPNDKLNDMIAVEYVFLGYLLLE